MSPLGRGILSVALAGACAWGFASDSRAQAATWVYFVADGDAERGMTDGPAIAAWKQAIDGAAATLGATPSLTIVRRAMRTSQAPDCTRSANNCVSFHFVVHTDPAGAHRFVLEYLKKQGGQQPLLYSEAAADGATLIPSALGALGLATNLGVCALVSLTPKGTPMPVCTAVSTSYPQLQRFQSCWELARGAFRLTSDRFMAETNLGAVETVDFRAAAVAAAAKSQSLDKITIPLSRSGRAGALTLETGVTGSCSITLKDATSGVASGPHASVMFLDAPTQCVTPKEEVLGVVPAVDRTVKDEFSYQCSTGHALVKLAKGEVRVTQAANVKLEPTFAASGASCIGRANLDTTGVYVRCSHAVGGSGFAAEEITLYLSDSTLSAFGTAVPEVKFAGAACAAASSNRALFTCQLASPTPVGSTCNYSATVQVAVPVPECK